MKRFLILALAFLAVSVSGMAQEELPRPVTNVLSLRVGQGRMRDTYLAPLLYTGSSIALEGQRWRMLRNHSWTGWQQADILFLTGEDHGRDSEAWAGRLRYRYGVLRRWSDCLDRNTQEVRTDGSPWSFYLGPYAGIDLGFDYNLKIASSNNPAAARVTTNLGAAGAVSYRFQAPAAQGMRVMLQAHGPLLGMGFCPEYGASYYETFYLDSSDNTFHFTSLHNQQDLDVQLSVDFPMAVIPWFRRFDSVIRLGGLYHIETMDINHITTRYSSLEFVIGWVYQYLPFSRRKASLLKRSPYDAY
jgi:hypothetical protein